MHFVNNELDRFDRQEIHFLKVRNQIGEFVQKSFSLLFFPPKWDFSQKPSRSENRRESDCCTIQKSNAFQTVCDKL